MIGREPGQRLLTGSCVNQLKTTISVRSLILSHPLVSDEHPILAEPLVVENGVAIIGNSIGTGVDWNEDAVQCFIA